MLLEPAPHTLMPATVDVAKDLGVSNPTLYRWIRASTPPYRALFSVFCGRPTQFVSSLACKTTHSLAFGAMIRPFNNNMEKMTGSINAISVANTLRLQPVPLSASRDRLRTT